MVVCVFAVHVCVCVCVRVCEGCPQFDTPICQFGKGPIRGTVCLVQPRCMMVSESPATPRGTSEYVEQEESPAAPREASPRRPQKAPAPRQVGSQGFPTFVPGDSGLRMSLGGFPETQTWIDRPFLLDNGFTSASVLILASLLAGHLKTDSPRPWPRPASASKADSKAVPPLQLQGVQARQAAQARVCATRFANPTQSSGKPRV